MNEQFQLLLRKEVYGMWRSGRSSKRTTSPQFKHSTADLTCWELVSVNMTMLREFGESLDEGSRRLSRFLSRNQCVAALQHL